MPSWSDSCQIGSSRDFSLSSVAAGDQLKHLVVLKMARYLCRDTIASNFRSLLTTVEWNVACVLTATCRSKCSAWILTQNLLLVYLQVWDWCELRKMSGLQKVWYQPEVVDITGESQSHISLGNGICFFFVWYTLQTWHVSHGMLKN